MMTPETIEPRRTTERAPERTSTDPMSQFGRQAGVSIAAGLAGLAVGGPVIATLGAVLGAVAGAVYPHLSGTQGKS